MKNLIGAFILVLSLAACSKEKFKKGPNGEGIFASSAEAVLAFHNSKIECKDLSKCPDSVGSLTTYEENISIDPQTPSTYSVGSCSFTLVAEGTILTNRHCIPISIKHAGTSCSEAIQINFPQTQNHQSEKLECDKVVALSPKFAREDDIATDWAVLSFKGKTERQAAVVGKSGVENHQSLNLYPAYVDFVENKATNSIMPIGKIEAVQCASDMSLVLPYFHKLSAILTLNLCSQFLVHGNSGTGLFSADSSEFVGVFSAIIDNLEKSMRGMATNVACIDPLSSQPSDMCYFEQNENWFSEARVLKMFTLLNNERYYEVEQSVPSRSPLYVRPGNGLVFKDKKTLQDAAADFPIIAKTPAILEYFVQQVNGFIFQNTALCVEKNAPEKFEEILQINSLVKMAEGLMDKPTITYTENSFSFKRIDSKTYAVQTLINGDPLSSQIKVCE